MGTFSTGRKVASFGSLILGLVLTIAGLGLSMTGAGDLILGTLPINGTPTPIIFGRGAMFVIGIVLFFVGLYLFPTFKHHRAIVNVIFLFPLSNRIRGMQKGRASAALCLILNMVLSFDGLQNGAPSAACHV